MRSKQGFTLIELLVVIAIIAILAAILFPVFARARSAAKTSMCSSNFHQVAEAFISYRGDANDRFPQTNYTAAWAGCSIDYRDKVFVQILQPYCKDMYIWRCPSDVNNTDAALSHIDDAGACPPPKKGFETYYMWSLRTDFGFNSYYLSPVVNRTSKGWGSAPITAARIHAEASTYLGIDTIWWRDRTGAPVGGGNWIAIPPSRRYKSPSGTLIDTWPLPPDATQYYGYNGWLVNNPLDWEVFGGCWPWHTDRCMVVYVDGHAKPATINQISAGVPNVLPGYAGPIMDLEAYKWDITE